MLNKLVLFSFFLTSLFLFSCKSSDVNSNCSFDLNLIKNKDWYPTDTSIPFLAKVKLTSGGVFYEDDTIKGTWTSPNNCNTIVINEAGVDWTFTIIQLSQNSLTIDHPLFGNLTYRT